MPIISLYACQLGKALSAAWTTTRPPPSLHVLLERRHQVRGPIRRIEIRDDDLILLEIGMEAGEIAARGRRGHHVHLEQAGLLRAASSGRAWWRASRDTGHRSDRRAASRGSAPRCNGSEIARRAKRMDFISLDSLAISPLTRNRQRWGCGPLGEGGKRNKDGEQQGQAPSRCRPIDKSIERLRRPTSPSG